LFFGHGFIQFDLHANPFSKDPGNGPTVLTSGDFNGDGVTDIATANTRSNSISVLLGVDQEGKGNGTFSTPEIYITGEDPTSIGSGDFNRDGISDIVI